PKPKPEPKPQSTLNKSSPLINGVLKEVVRSPQYRESPRAPEYPRKALRRKLEGMVMIRVLVGADGANQRVIIQQSSGHEVLDQAALEAVTKWRFVPSRYAGKAVAAWVEVPVNFKLR
ncbi:energy transducer TonB, partial [Pontibacter sp. JAM-7]|uniref:energy transducer TonB n=1 Tax=Pontibacter sp. JAM-7 TaxID=3366581 RepID=UPI003AF89BFF